MNRILRFGYWILLMLPFLTMAQTPAKYWVQFTDKEGTPYSVQQPEAFLSPRAIALRNAHHISIDESDLPVNPAYIQQILSIDSNIHLCTRSKWHNAITVYIPDDTIVKIIQDIPFVQSIERTITLKKNAKDSLALTKESSVFQYVTNGEPTYTYLTDIIRHQDFAYGKSEEQIRLNNAHWLHRMGFRGENMLMVLMDGGFRHVDTLSAFKNMRKDHRLLGTRNFVHSAESPFSKQHHGTIVLSCIASYLPGRLVGSAPMAQFYLCQTEDGDSENKIEEDNWVAGIELADSLGCQVLNSSLGYTTFDDTTQVREYKDMNGQTSRASIAATIAASKGMIVCNSAGNEGHQKWEHIGSPADAKDILTVGAVDMTGLYAPFSSTGPTADGRVKPDVCAVGYNMWTVNAGGIIQIASGTSFSSPLLSGMVSCLWQAFPEKSNLEIMDAIRQSSSQYKKPDDKLGYGIPDFLRAYNILNQPKPDNAAIFFDSFVAKEDTLTVHISAQTQPAISFEDQTKDVAVIQISYEKVGDFYDYTIVFPHLPKKIRYRIHQLNIKVGEREYHYIITQE